MTVIDFIQKLLQAGVTGSEEIVVRNAIDAEILDDVADVQTISDPDNDDEIQVVITLAD